VGGRGGWEGEFTSRAAPRALVNQDSRPRARMRAARSQRERGGRGRAPAEHPRAALPFVRVTPFPGATLRPRKIYEGGPCSLSQTNGTPSRSSPLDNAASHARRLSQASLDSATMSITANERQREREREREREKERIVTGAHKAKSIIVECQPANARRDRAATQPRKIPRR